MRNRIETDQLVLRSFENEDLTALVTYAGDIDVARATGQLPHPYTMTEAQSWLDYNQTKPSTNAHIYAIASQDNQLLGCISLTPKGKAWELGYWLGQPHWHKGIMREASSALLKEARTELAPTTLHAVVFMDNPRSLALLKYHGFTHAGQTSVFCVARDHEVDAYQLTLALEAHHA